jgi:hypothetical protein
VRRARGGAAEVLVVCPALNSPLRHWVSDEDEARAAAQARLEASLAAMRAAGLEARGEIGTAIRCRRSRTRAHVPPDELIISTHPEGRSHWLERGRRRPGRASASRCPSRTSSSTSRPNPSPYRAWGT